jgi:glycosyltransferase involved in cell wall biosynthesis
VDRLWDSPRVISALASRSLSTNPKLLGDLTISRLAGEGGVLRKEFDKLLEWVRAEPVPDVINLPNSLLIGLARPLRQALNRPVCCTLQGEDLFLRDLEEPYRTQALELIRRQVPEVDGFVAVSDAYVPVMSRLLAIPPERITVVPLGINLAGYERRSPRETAGQAPARPGMPDLVPFTIGYFARVAPEKGLHLLAEAYCRLRKRAPGARMRLEAAGYLARANVEYLSRVRSALREVGLADEFTYHGIVDRPGKLAFLRSLDVLSVPTTYDEPKGVFLLEAMASGVPVVQPRRGAFVEIVEKTGGGLLVSPDDPEALAQGLFTLWQDRALGERLGQRGFDGVREHYGIARAVDRLISVYESSVGRASARRGAGEPRVPLAARG